VHAGVEDQKEIPPVRKSELESRQEKSKSVERANNQRAARLSFAPDGVEQCFGIPSPAYELVLQLQNVTLSVSELWLR
jgi:hypothetical protein